MAVWIYPISNLAAQNRFEGIISFPNSSFDKGTVINQEAILEDADLRILYFKNSHGKRFEIENSTVVGLNMQNMKYDYFKAINTVFLNARINGTVFSRCELGNVKFVNSDLSFSNLSSCKIKNIIFENSVSYDLSDY